MNPRPIAFMAGVTLGVALAVMLAALVLHGRLARWRTVLMPLALAAGLTAGYVTLMDFPRGSGDRPWYLDDAWKMAIVAALGAGVLLALAAVLPKWAGVVIWVLASAAVTWLLVRRTWDGWNWYAGGLAAAEAVYLLSLAPAWRVERLFLVGPLVMWASAASSALVVMAWVDQSLGRILVMLAVLAGVAAATGILHAWRAMAAEAAAFLAVVYGGVVMLAVFYNPDPPLPLGAFVLMGSGPLGAAMVWVPGLRKRPWLCVVLALAATLALVVPGALWAARYGPALE